jgi:hypothetical protein
MLLNPVRALRVDGVRYVPVADEVHVDLALAWRRDNTSPALARLLEALEANAFVPPDSADSVITALAPPSPDAQPRGT